MKLAKVLIAFTAAVLLLGTGFLIFTVWSRHRSMEYQFQVEAVLNAASIANQQDPQETDPEKSVIAEYDGKRTVVVPGNYRALSSYLRKDAASLLFFFMNREKALKLTVCGEAVLTIAPQTDSGDVVLIEMTTLGQTFHMRADGGNLWTNLLACSMKGTYHDENIPLE